MCRVQMTIFGRILRGFRKTKSVCMFFAWQREIAMQLEYYILRYDSTNSSYVYIRFSARLPNFVRVIFAVKIFVVS